MIGDQENYRRVVVERLGDGVVPDFLVEELGGRHDFHGVEGGERHVDAVEGGEVAELLKGGGFGGEVSGFDLPANLFDGFGNEEGFFDLLLANALYQVVEIALEKGLHYRSARHSVN